MGYNQEVGEITQILQEIKDKAPRKYEQIKKEIMIKHAEINLIDTFFENIKRIR